MNGRRIYSDGFADGMAGRPMQPPMGDLDAIVYRCAYKDGAGLRNACGFGGPSK